MDSFALDLHSPLVQYVRVQLVLSIMLTKVNKNIELGMHEVPA